MDHPCVVILLAFASPATFFSVHGVRRVYLRIRGPIDALMGVALGALDARLATSR